MKKIILFLLVFITFECFSQETDVVVIGQQKWMKKNLEVTKFRNGEVIFQAKNAAEWKKANLNKQAAWCYYKFDPLNGKKYGKLYNWFAVNDPRGLAPLGWHVPSKNEWNTLIDFLGPYEANKVLKSKSGWGSFKELGGQEVEYCSSCSGMGKVPDDNGRYGTCWNCGGKGQVLVTVSDKNKLGNGADRYGFTALPGGYYSPDGKFEEVGATGKWWSMTANYHLGAWFLKMITDSREKVLFHFTEKEFGLSVRCINGETAEVNPVLSSEAKIGNQIWMTKNLEVDKFRNGDKIFYAKTLEEWKNANLKKIPAYCYYDNDPIKGNWYGKLYNYYAINDVRGLAPEGWEIPETADLKILMETIKNKNPDKNTYKYEDSIATKLKSKSWWWFGQNGVDQFGFAALPGGYVSSLYSLRFEDEVKTGKWWLKANPNDDKVYYFYISQHGDYNTINTIDFKNQDIVNYKYGLSVRCIKKM